MVPPWHDQKFHDGTPKIGHLLTIAIQKVHLLYKFFLAPCSTAGVQNERLNFKPLFLLDFFMEFLYNHSPPEAEVRGSNPLGRAIK